MKKTKSPTEHPPRRGALAVALASLALFAGCGGPEPVDPIGANFEEAAVQLRIQGSFPESPPPGFIPRATFVELREKLQLVAETARARGLLLKLGPLGGSMGQMRDVQALVDAVRAAEKPVHCHFDTLDNAGYLFAAESCERLTMSPAGHLDLVGFASQLLFAADLLESAGINAELLAIGRYKSAADALTERSLPETTAESVGAILDHFTEELVAAVESRASSAGGRQLIDAGPYFSASAREAGLVDEVEYEHEARAALREAAKVEEIVTLEVGPEVKEPSFGEILQALSREPEEKEPGAYVALVTLAGTILDGNEGEAGSIVSGPYVRHLRALAEDEDAKAVVLRVDSPGGSALASDLIYAEVRALAEKKPVIASVSSMAASGGYYIAAGAREIFAHESSLVGSIGVVGGKIDVSPLAARLGVHVATLERGANAAYSSPFTPFDEGQRRAVRGMLEATYARFVEAVAEGRGMSEREVAAAAEGRVFTGQAGKALGLVDTLGGFEAAVSRARELATIEDSVPLRAFPVRKDLFESLADALSPGAGAATASRAELLRAAFPSLGEAALSWLRLAQTSPGPYAALPYWLDLR